MIKALRLTCKDIYYSMVYNCQKRKEAKNIKQKGINYIAYYVTKCNIKYLLK